MTDLNHVVVIGRLTRDLGADERAFAYTPNGTARANISIAVNRSVRRGEQWEDEANFFDVTIWGKTAENLRPYLTKGKQIAIDGYLKQDRWEKDGQKFSKVTIQANNVQLIGGRGDSQGQSSYGQGTQQPRFQPKNDAAQYSSAGGNTSYGQYGGAGSSYGHSDMSDFPEDIPF